MRRNAPTEGLLAAIKFQAELHRPDINKPKKPKLFRFIYGLKIPATYFFLCLFFLRRFFLLWVAILCLFLFFPLGIVVIIKV